MSLASLFKRLTAPEALRPYASISEQIVMSGSNMLASLVVVKAAGVAWFGIYSFIFVLTTLANGVFATLLHRQMMLYISPIPDAEKGDTFLATVALECLFMLVGVGFVIALFLLFGNSPWVIQYRWEIIASIAYVCLYNLFDLFKQFLYSTDNQVYSLRCTIVFVGLQTLALGWILLSGLGDSTVYTVYWVFAACLLASLLSNRRCQHTLKQAAWHGWGQARNVFQGYFRQGRFSLIGMGVTWVQNQSMNPFLMFISGPLVAGYFSLARLLVMPMAVIGQGLVNSTTPTLRRIYKQDTLQELVRRIASLNFKNLMVSLAYIVLLLVAHFSGLFDRFVPSYSEVKWYLALWVVILTVTMYRFWIGQFFVVSMQFRFMLNVGIIALIVSMSGMLFFGVAMQQIKIALSFVVVGELLTVALFLLQRRKFMLNPPAEQQDSLATTDSRSARQ